ncbi:MAG: AbrB/MazE/SpoVT family DNA-binding domain-containing protein [Candidatus Taylorbacteria bacterium]
MTQKVIQIGSSAGITIPKKSLKELGLKIGDDVRVDVDPKKRKVVIEVGDSPQSEVVEWTDLFIHRYSKALKALANK